MIHRTLRHSSTICCYMYHLLFFVELPSIRLVRKILCSIIILASNTRYLDLRHIDLIRTVRTAYRIVAEKQNEFCAISPVWKKCVQQKDKRIRRRKFDIIMSIASKILWSNLHSSCVILLSHLDVTATITISESRASFSLFSFSLVSYYYT